MLPVDPVLHHQIPVIQKIIQDETWLEGERRGCRVTADDRVVRENVCRVILRVGQEIRDSVTRDLQMRNTAALPLTRTTTTDALDWQI